ncbi:MAG: hypothetical protein RRC07_13930 [Anaerolineae bacterium]|nr:hypothetical protein [Anaerolineae bacterium]
MYLAGLAPSSRRTMRVCLDTIAHLGLGNPDITLWNVPWHRLRCQHTQAIRSALADRYTHHQPDALGAARRRAGTAVLGAGQPQSWQPATMIDYLDGCSPAALYCF